MMAWCLLVVDDSDDHRFITVTELQRLKLPKWIRIEEASNGDEALRKLQERRAAGERILLLSDYRMPRMGGIELLRHVRATFPVDAVRVVIYSSTDQGVAGESMTHGADRFLVKPMDLQQFRADLRRLVDNFILDDGSRPAARRS